MNNEQVQELEKLLKTLEPIADTKAYYDQTLQIIWRSGDAYDNMLADAVLRGDKDATRDQFTRIRGWGNLQKLADGDKVQDAVGEFFTWAWNNKAKILSLIELVQNNERALRDWAEHPD